MQDTQETRIQSLGGEDPLEETMETHSSILAGKFQGQWSLAGYSPWGHKELDMTEQLSTWDWRKHSQREWASGGRSNNQGNIVGRREERQRMVTV